MTEFSVNDRVLVPGVVEQWDNHKAYGVRIPTGDRVWIGDDDLRPDTGGRDGRGRNEQVAPDEACGRCLHRGDLHDSSGWCLKWCGCEAFVVAAGPRADDESAEQYRPLVDHDLEDVTFRADDDETDIRIAAAGPRAGDAETAEPPKRNTGRCTECGATREACDRQVADEHDPDDGGSLCCDQCDHNDFTGGAGATAPAGPEPTELAEKLAPVLDHLISQVVQDVGDLPTLRNRAAVELVKVAIEQLPARAGATAPDDGMCKHGRLADSCLDCAREAMEEVPRLRIEIARLRSDAAALRAAGDALCEAADALALHGETKDRQAAVWRATAAWRSAAGSPDDVRAAPQKPAENAVPRAPVEALIAALSTVPKRAVTLEMVDAVAEVRRHLDGGSPTTEQDGDTT